MYIRLSVSVHDNYYYREEEEEEGDNANGSRTFHISVDTTLEDDTRVPSSQSGSNILRREGNN